MNDALQLLPASDFDAPEFTVVGKNLDWLPVELVATEVAIEMPPRAQAWFATYLGEVAL